VLPDELRHPRQALGRAVRSAETARVVSELDRRLTRYRRDRKLGAGTFRGMRVVVHRGYVVDDEVRVHLRVMEEPAMPDVGEDLALVAAAKQNARRFFALGMPQVEVVVTVEGVQTTVVTARRGYAAGVLTVPGLTPGWHEVHAEVLPEDADHDGAVGEGVVIVPEPTAPFSVISDIDDTILRTGLTEGLTAFATTLLSDANNRAAIPGMASLYRGLARAGGTDAGYPSFFYVSTGSWSMYPVLTKFLQGRGFPRGPLFLTDWGPTDRYVTRSGAEHKRSTIRRLLDGYPDQRFVCIGDSGQGDPDVYLETARAFPGRIAAVLIIDVGAHLAERADELTQQALELQSDGLQFHFVRDAYQATGVCLDLGLCDAATVDEVETELLASG
jgi:phosphatidate phosphatase APP1